MSNDFLPIRETVFAALTALAALALAVLLGGCATAGPPQALPWHQDALHTSPHLPLCCTCHTPQYDH